MSPFLQRAQMLIQQSRFELAETELRQALVNDPDNPLAHALQAICLVEMNKFNEATAAVNTAISLAPDSAFSFYVASLVSVARNQLKKAESEIQQAISMDHTQPDYFAQLASIKIQQKKWQEGLEAAETGLEMDPEDVTCTNLRAIAMVKLGRKAEAGSTIQSALEKAPEDARSHANMGWTLLERSKPKEAMPHFREALRLEPNMEWARAGIVEAMKSQYLIYRLMLGWFLWSSKLDSRTLMFILIGGYIGANFASRVAAQNPALQPFLLPLIIAYVGFVIMTWVSVPMFNLLLRFNKFGRLALSPQEKRTSTLVGLCLLLAIVFVVLTFATGQDAFILAALAAGLMTPIVATYYQSDPGWPRAVHGLLVIGFSAFALMIIAGSIATCFTTDGTQNALRGLLGLSITPLIVVAVGSQFAVNFLSMAKPTRGTDNAKLVWLIGGIILAVVTLVALAFVALILSMSDRLADKEFGMPIRISIVKSGDLNWTDQEELGAATQELQKLGFVTGDDFTCPEIDGFKSRYFLHSDGFIAASLAEHPNSLMFQRSMSLMFDDDRVVSLTNVDEGLAVPPNWDVRVTSATAAEMYRELQVELKNGTARKFTMDELPRVEEELYANLSDFLLARGGHTDEEIRAIAAETGMSLDDKEVLRYQTEWKRDTKQNIEAFVINEFVRSNPEFEGRQESLLCVNRYSQDSGVGVASVLDLTPYLREFTAEQIMELGKVEPTEFRERFSERIDPSRIERVGQTTVPIPTDIYLRK